MMSAPWEGGDRTSLDGFELEIFKLVREHATFEQWREWLRVPLEHAAADGHMDLFERLMFAGANGRAGWRGGCHGRTLLGAAARGKNEEMVLALVRAGAKDDVDVQFGARELSALHVAVAHGAEAVSMALITAGADPNLVDGEHNTPLHLAARGGHDVIVSDLLMTGADPNAKNGHQYTPLHLAAKKGWELCASKLLLGGAEKNSRTITGETPLCLAAEYNHLGVVDELLAAKADPGIRAGETYRPLEIAACLGCVDVMKSLLRHGDDIKACDHGGYTALHYAVDLDGASRNNGDVVRLLLEAGAAIEAKTTQIGIVPLHHAANRRTSSIGTMEALLDGGANVNARSTNECTPLQYACANSNVGAVELLLRWGADETLVDRDAEAAEDWVGKWEPDYRIDDEERKEERKIDDQDIRRMLARAPADRAWRRRGWLVLARFRPARVQLAHDSRSSNSDSSTKAAKARCDGLGVGEGGAAEQATINFDSLVRRVVDLDAEGVFRLVIGFL